MPTESSTTHRKLEKKDQNDHQTGKRENEQKYTSLETEKSEK